MFGMTLLVVGFIIWSKVNEHVFNPIENRLLHLEGKSNDAHLRMERQSSMLGQLTNEMNDNKDNITVLTKMVYAPDNALAKIERRMNALDDLDDRVTETENEGFERENDVGILQSDVLRISNNLNKIVSRLDQEIFLLDTRLTKHEKDNH